MPLRLADRAGVGKIGRGDGLAAVGKGFAVEGERGALFGKAPFVVRGGSMRTAPLGDIGLDVDDLGLGDTGDAGERIGVA